MPKLRSRQSFALRYLSPRKPAVVFAMVGVFAAHAVAADTPTAIRSREIELHYRLNDPTPAADVQLWYTRDRGATWQMYGRNDDRMSPIHFVAPAEGLYGFIILIKDKPGSAEAPAPFQPAQRWVFVDYTPPLVQWDGVEPADAVQLRWTAHDDHLPARPIGLSYQSSLDQKWENIDPALPNIGRYDWVLPESLAGQITVKLTVQDLGGHVIERTYGPIPAEKWLKVAPKVAVATTQPAFSPAATQPSAADLAQNQANLAKRRKAEELYQQGGWHLARGQYNVAAERFREAIELDPEQLSAMSDLGRIYYQQKDYTKAIELYNGVLARDAKHTAALRGSALAYVGQKDYARSRDALQRLLAGNNKDAEAWLDLGDVLFMMGDQTEARSHWGRAADVDASADAIIRKARRRLELYATGSPVARVDIAP
jgi:tetratricopeptide (TPR) repeat protein